MRQPAWHLDLKLHGGQPGELLPLHCPRHTLYLHHALSFARHSQLREKVVQLRPPPHGFLFRPLLSSPTLHPHAPSQLPSVPPALHVDGGAHNLDWGGCAHDSITLGWVGPYVGGALSGMRIVNYQLQLIIPANLITINSPDFRTVLPRESLGVSREGITPC